MSVIGGLGKKRGLVTAIGLVTAVGEGTLSTGPWSGVHELKLGLWGFFRAGYRVEHRDMRNPGV
jgi:hypothetical protein